MSTLFWPGDERAGELFSEAGLLAAMLAVETAWLGTLTAAGIAPSDARRDLTDLAGPDDLDALGAAAAGGGNPVIPLVALLRDRLHARGDAAAATWLHRGLTSQDVLDTAVVLMARDTRAVVMLDLRGQATLLAALAHRHRATRMTGRTLTQHAVPITFGAKVAGWLEGLLDAAVDVDRLTFPVQCGGAAGTLSGVTVLTRGDGAGARELAGAFAGTLGLTARPPWHTDRAPLTRIAEAFARCTSAWGRIANDVLTLSRPEIGELAEATGGGSSTMPQKANPVLSVLVRRAALAAPATVSALHLAAADTRDERPDGAWHLEWQSLQQLARHTVTAATQTSSLLEGLRVDVTGMAARLDGAVGLDAEAQALGELVGGVPRWAGADDALITTAVTRTAEWLGEHG